MLYLPHAITLLFLHLQTVQSANKEIIHCKTKNAFLYKTHPNITKTGTPIRHNLKESEIPPRFDSREKWPHCKSIRRIKHQGYCGACWAFASTSVIADRICIASKGTRDIDISTLELMSCCSSCHQYTTAASTACLGGFVEKGLEYWMKQGLVSGEGGCKPLTPDVYEGFYSESCEEECTNREYKVSYYVDKLCGTEWRYLNPSKDGILQVQAEIMRRGPVVAGFTNYEYLTNMSKNSVIVYDEELVKKGERGGDHAVKIIGWDVRPDGTPVWILANSYGEGWCDGGFCAIRRGTNELGLEGNLMMGVSTKEQEEDEQENKDDQKKKDDVKVVTRISVVTEKRKIKKQKTTHKNNQDVHDSHKNVDETTENEEETKPTKVVYILDVSSRISINFSVLQIILLTIRYLV